MVKNSKKVLIAPLNWGLGHATRCMPIIDAFLEQGAEVMLASDGAAYHLLKKEYPNLPIFELPAYNIRYPFANMVLSMASQMPKILRGCILENFWLKNFTKTQHIDIIISDNRFGFYHKKIKSIFITHQINIQAPFSKFINTINHYFINKFNECWIPDFEDEKHNLSGKLSHCPTTHSKKFRYIGALSRFRYNELKKKYKIAAILSGPEPQRTYFEEKIIAQFAQLENHSVFNNLQFVLVRGVVDDNTFIIKLKNTLVYNYLTTKDLNKLILESNIIIARSGYSTVMDLTALNAHAILIPTEGQTEQIYIAEKLKTEGICFSENQAQLDILKALAESESYSGFNKFFMNTHLLEEIINDILKF